MLRMKWGLDGARGGWVLSRLRPELPGGAEVRFCASLAEASTFTGSDRVAVDMPIGLGTGKAPARDWDIRAREILKGRLSSRVFTPPIRELLGCASYAEANARSRSLIGKGLSVQAWNLVPKIRELEAFLSAHTESRKAWQEEHPEIAFARLNHGTPLIASKKTAVGLEIRMHILKKEAAVDSERVWASLVESLSGIYGRLAKDDVVDSLALAAVESAFP